jgi:hypothetical protein
VVDLVLRRLPLQGGVDRRLELLFEPLPRTDRGGIEERAVGPDRQRRLLAVGRGTAVVAVLHPVVAVLRRCLGGRLRVAVPIATVSVPVPAVSIAVIVPAAVVVAGTAGQRHDDAGSER